MSRTVFERELLKLQHEVLSLGVMVKNAILASVDILKRRDLEGARKLIEADKVLNDKRFAIEHQTIVSIATQQPMASDLRSLASVLEIATELERIGDYAKGIAKIALRMGSKPFVKPLIDIPRMAEKAGEMLQTALQAFVEQDAELARAIPAEDAEMDLLYNQIYRELMTYVIADPKLMERASYLIWVAHNLERAADRVVNICERIIFTVTGEMIELDNAGPGELPYEEGEPTA